MPRDYRKNTSEFRLRQKHGEHFEELVTDLYVARKMTARQVARELGVCLRSALRILRDLGLTRDRSAAVALQWEGNTARREAIGVIFSASVRSRQHWALGLTKDSHPGIKSTAAKLSDRKWLSAPDTVAKALVTRSRIYRDDPSRHAQSRVKMSSVEGLVAKWLRSTGREFVFQHPVTHGDRLMFADFYLPSCRVIIEPTLKVDRVTPERLKSLRVCGYLPIAILNRHIIKSGFSELDEKISRAERGKFNPTTVGECWVRRRPNKSSPAYRYFDEPLLTAV